jgi:hypothetical protein
MMSSVQFIATDFQPSRRFAETGFDHIAVVERLEGPPAILSKSLFIAGLIERK